MSPDDMLALAEHDKHMAEWSQGFEKHYGGLAGLAWACAADRYRESARYWREKARENG